MKNIEKSISLYFIDHTTQNENGYFMDTSALTANQSARLISPVTSIPARGICIRFWYRVYGSRQGRLHLRQKPTISENSTLVYTLRGNQDIDWREAIVFRGTTGNYQFILEAIVPAVLSSYDNIAIDDITSNEGNIL